MLRMQVQLNSVDMPSCNHRFLHGMWNSHSSFVDLGAARKVLCHLVAAHLQVWSSRSPSIRGARRRGLLSLTVELVALKNRLPKHWRLLRLLLAFDQASPRKRSAVVIGQAKLLQWVGACPGALACNHRGGHEAHSRGQIVLIPAFFVRKSCQVVSVCPRLVEMLAPGLKIWPPCGRDLSRVQRKPKEAHCWLACGILGKSKATMSSQSCELMPWAETKNPHGQIQAGGGLFQR